jgi:hypothetical protein
MSAGGARAVRRARERACEMVPVLKQVLLVSLLLLLALFPEMETNTDRRFLSSGNDEGEEEDDDDDDDDDEEDADEEDDENNDDGTAEAAGKELV